MDRPILPVVLDDHAIERMAEREIPADVRGACLACPTRTGAHRRRKRPVAELAIGPRRGLRVCYRVAHGGALVVYTAYGCRPRASPD